VPFVTVALTTTVPGAIVLSMLPPVMIAPVCPALCMLQMIVVFVALAGTTVPVSISGVVIVLTRGISEVISVTATNGAAATVMLNICV
jgi:hypothetical protein